MKLQSHGPHLRDVLLRLARFSSAATTRWEGRTQYRPGLSLLVKHISSSQSWM